jgi:hypothetical protein
MNARNKTRKPGDTEYDGMPKRQAHRNDRWLVQKCKPITVDGQQVDADAPEVWRCGPRELGVYAFLANRRRHAYFDSLVKAGDYARERTGK